MIRAFKVLCVGLAMLVSLELLLQFAPIPDPYAQLRRAQEHRVHLYLPTWNVWSDWFSEEPPFVTTFQTGPLSGVSTTSVTIDVNSFGFLYDESLARRGAADELRIGVVGGSTVECSALAAGKRWPDVLGRVLSEGVGDRKVTVLNLGVSGTDSRAYLATVAEHAVKLDLDYLVFLMGANDLFRVGLEENPLQEEGAFRQVPRLGAKGAVLRLQLARRLRILFNRARGTEFYVADIGVGQPYFAARVGEISTLPVLDDEIVTISDDMLEDYERNVISLAALSAAHGIRPVFLTQPMLWKNEMDETEQSVDWLIGTVIRNGARYRLTPESQSRSLESLNERLLEICARERLDCVDVASRIPRSLDYFYDSVHFNENGAEEVAAVVGQAVQEFASR